MPNSEVLKVTSEYEPAGDQPQAIEEIVKSLDTLLKKDGVQSIKSVTGIDHKKWLS